MNQEQATMMTEEEAEAAYQSFIEQWNSMSQEEKNQAVRWINEGFNQGLKGS